MNSYTLAKRRELGAYYTPPELSQALANWAIRSVEDSLLEPSFGGCGFLESCVTRLRQLGNDCPEQNLYGVDIDETAFEILAQKFQISDISNKFIFDDFINVKPDDFTQKNFDIVIGNPPYISMHNMTSKQRISCQDVLDKSIYNERTLGRNSSLWAFFLLHSLSFLNENGRVAWVLPSSLLHAYYASALINIHKKHFSKIKVIKINERFFKDAGADEASVIFVCEGFSSKEVTDGLYNVYSAENVNSLNIILNDRSVRISSKHDNFKLNLLPSEILLTYENISTQSNCLLLNEIISIKIGMVTGANEVFVISNERKNEYNLSDSYLRPVVSRFSDLVGVRHNVFRQNKLIGNNKRALLLHASEEQMSEKFTFLRKYLAKVSSEKRGKNRTFKKRHHWYQPDDGLYPHAFLSYMLHEGPRMVINQAKINCTNSIHRVYFKKKNSTKYKIAVCLSLLSCYSQLSAEIEGRSYGSGVLKIEPTAARNIKIILNDSCMEDLFNAEKSIEKFLNENNFKKACQTVDDIFIKNGIFTIDECNNLKKGLRFLRNDRYKGVKANVDEQ